MSIKKRIAILLFLFLGMFFPAHYFAQHETGYSQYYFNGLAINPAYCGSGGVLNSTLVYRNQWTGFKDAPQTASLAIHSPLKNQSCNLGLFVMNERFGITNKYRYQGAFAYKVKLNQKLNLRFGVQAGMESVYNNYSKLTTIESGDLVFTNGNAKTNYFTSGAGLYLHSEKGFVGVSMPSFATEKNSFIVQNKPAFIYAGRKFRMNKDFVLQPSLLFKYIKSSPLQYDLNLQAILFDKAGLGFSYRKKESVVINAFFQINEEFFVGYSYDVNINTLGRLGKGSHEMVLRYEFGFSKNVQNPKTFF
ncbi:MAG: PorP/SprF family type IX secretion system membrane protein [Bacteroidia bacterium]|nr:PorP/SprF family type IX secretion system membrane protein [Bacteroidia bacterium]